MILDNFPNPGYDFFRVRNQYLLKKNSGFFFLNFLYDYHITQQIMVVTHLILYIPVNFVIMRLGCLLLCDITILLTVISRCPALRYSLVRMFANMKSENLNFFTHTVLTGVMLVGITALVLLLLGLGLASGDAFSLILNITGGVGGTLLVIHTYIHTYILLYIHTVTLLWQKPS